MLYIQKKSPPQEMIRRVSQIKSSTDWKNISESDTQAIRRQFDLMPKDIIRQSLLEEQHYLCAYCMKKITNDG